MARDFKMYISADTKNSRGINSKTLKDKIKEMASANILRFPLFTSGSFLKNETDDMFFTTSKKIEPLALFFEEHILGLLVQQGEIVRGNTKITNYEKHSDSSATFSIGMIYKQKHCINDTILVLKFDCFYE